LGGTAELVSSKQDYVPHEAAEKSGCGANPCRLLIEKMPAIHATIRSCGAAFLAVMALSPGFGLAVDETPLTNLLSPPRISIGQALPPEEVNRLVEVEGPVSFVGMEEHTVNLEIGSEAGYMSVNIAQEATGLTDLLLRSRIRARGICIAVHSSVDGKIVGSLLVSNLDDIVILQLPEETWQRYPACTISALMQTNAFGQIVHLRGRVQSVQPGRSFLMADDTGQVSVESRQALPESAGTDVGVLGVWRWQDSTNRVFQGVFSRPAGEANHASPAITMLTTTEQIRWLKPDEAKRGYPVKVRGVVTFLTTRNGKTAGGSIQDGTGGASMWHLDASGAASQVKVGDFCEVEGDTSAGSFSPQILCQKLTVLGEGQMPEPIHPNWDELIDGGLDTQWVEVEGIGLSVTNHFLNLGMKGGYVSCRISVGQDFERYVGAVLRVRGAVLVRHDSDRHVTGLRINVPAQKFISIETPASDEPFSAPARHVQDLLAYDPDETAFRQVKVTGQIIHQRGGVCYMMDGTNGLRLIPKSVVIAGPGDSVEAVGFPEIDSPSDKPLVTLREAVVRKTGQVPLPAPVKLTPDDLLDREHDSTLVRLESRLLNVSRYPAEQVLELQAGTLVYIARLNTAAGQIPQLLIGSRLNLTGVYAISGDKSVPFELLLNSPADIRVLELPSWWTVQHALIVVCSMALAMLLSVIWIRMLHRQVGRRTESLREEITERKRMEDELVRTRLQHLVEQERTRIARDLHDDLGSRVTRIVLLLDELALQHRMPLHRAAEYPLEISAAAREIIQSLDETVWAVNPRNDTVPHLIDYLGQFAIEFLKVANVLCRLDFPEHPPGQMITTEARHNLYLTMKEALNNAVRHAQATEVWLRAAVHGESLVLTVEDNGRGFERASEQLSAEGFRNMQQRMEDIGGHFNIKSTRNAGTKVTLTYFWPPAK
jgi:signal transduction histidine kinase